MPPQFDWSRREVLYALPLLAAFGCAGSNLGSEAPAVTIDGALSRLRKGLRKQVRDKNARRRALARVDELGEVLVALDDIAWEWRTKVRVEIEQASDPTRLDVIAGDTKAAIRAELVRASGIGVALRGDIGPEEWSRVFPVRKEEPA